MRNLKRALSLILAAAMLIGMMVVGAGAVSYNDFPDRDEIVNKDAVSMLTTWGSLRVPIRAPTTPPATWTALRWRR